MSSSHTRLPTSRRPRFGTAARMALALLPTVVPGLATAQDAPESARLLRFPHIRGDRIVFTHGGDVWAGTLDGTRVRARRLTSHDEGFEVFARLSPDGRHVAYSGERSGSRQIWIVPFEGGEPRRLTWYPDVGPMPPRGGYDNLPFDWTPDGSRILIRSNRTPYGQRVGKYFLVDPTGETGPEEPLQIPEGGPASFAPDGKRLAYNIISREWRTWKRYTAGRAQDVWIYDLEADTVRRITDHPGTDNWPMWIGDTVYFTSDRADGTLNLWAHDLATGTDRPVTQWDSWDVLFPARGGDRIVFERGGWLWLCDAENPGRERIARLDVTLGDDRPFRNPYWFDGSGALGDFSVSPSAKSVAVEVRGELFTLPRAHGDARNVTQSPGRREMMPRWSPDGRRLAYVAETERGVRTDDGGVGGGDYEVFVRGLRLGEEVQLTRGSGAWPLSISWSPDGERLAVTDKRNRLRVVDVASRRVDLVDEGPEGPIRQVQWSADGAWLTYVKDAPNGLSTVWIAAAGNRGGEPPRQVTSADWPSDSPTFDPDGELLYFVSSRTFVYGQSPSFERKIFALLLRDDVPNPVAPRQDVEPAIAGVSDATVEARADRGRADDGGLRIDFDGLEDRLVVLPLPARDDYGALFGVEGGVLFTQGSDHRRYDLESREASTILEGMGRAVSFTPDRGQFVYRHRGRLATARTAPGQKAGADVIPTDGLRVRIDPAVEWRQIYRDAWRLMRDWFYDERMHRVDWDAVRSRYEPLIDHVSHRADLDFVLGEVIGELNAGHTYVQPGQMPRVERVDTGVLGARLEKGSRYHRFAEIHPGQPWDPGRRNPLREPGVGIEEGDWLIAIDGVEVPATDDPYRHLEGKVDVPVELTVSDTESPWTTRTVVVRPRSSELELRYLGWVEANRALVDRLSGGRIGYMHVPNTAVPGHRAVWEGWRAVARGKEAVVVDDRYNGGGFIPDRMIHHIGRRVLNWWSRRHMQLQATPDLGFDGPMAMLINGYSSSGGDAFPYYFRALGLGKLVGATTWGGLIGYSGTPRFVDGGGLAVPGFAFVNKDGQWDVEAYGVAPDIEVFDDPTADVDPVIRAAVEHLLRELGQRGPVQRPAVPEGPDRRGLVEPPPGSSGRPGGK